MPLHYTRCMPKKTPPATVEDKLDEIIRCLHRLDKRDRARTIGGFFKSLIGFIPIIILIGSVWYAYRYGDELLEKIAQQAAKQAAIMTEQGTDSVMQRFGGFLGQ